MQSVAIQRRFKDRGPRPNSIPQFTRTKEESVRDFLKKIDFVGEGENPVWTDNLKREGAIAKLRNLAHQWHRETGYAFVQWAEWRQDLI